MKIEKLFSVSGKIVIITGVCGKLGQSYLRFLLLNDAIVIGIDKIDSSGNKSIEKEFNNYFFFKRDLTEVNEIEELSIHIKKEIGVPNGLINNAAIDSPPSDNGIFTQSFEKLEQHVWDKVLDVNLKSLVFTSKFFGSIMSDNNGGSIINISSIYGMISPDQSLYQYKRDQNIDYYKPIAYSASKSGVLNVTKYLAVYWAKKRIRVNNLVLSGVYDNQDEQFLVNYCKRIPIGRMAKSDEFNGAIAFLLSDASSYMTGSNLIVDGGWTSI